MEKFTLNEVEDYLRGFVDLRNAVINFRLIDAIVLLNNPYNGLLAVAQRNRAKNKEREQDMDTKEAVELNRDVTLNEYQERAHSTSKGTLVGGSPLVYPALKLPGEAGEVAEKVGKLFRDKGGVLSPEDREQLILELGDVLWYVSEIATVLNTTLQRVARRNLEKLASRKERGVIGGSGDNR